MLTSSDSSLFEVKSSKVLPLTLQKMETKTRKRVSRSIGKEVAFVEWQATNKKQE